MKIIYLKRPGWWMAAALAAVLILCLVITTRCAPAAPATVSGRPLDGVVVLIDPGHGGFDPGAVAEDGTHEDELNLAISLRLAQSLREKGATVILTRMGNGALGNTKREDMARRLELVSGSGADIVISVHMNHFPVSRYFGAQVFYRTGDEESERLATLIQDTLRSEVDPDNTRLCKPSKDYGVLNIAEAPAVLLECGFISNSRERNLLKRSSYQTKIAKAVAGAVAAYCAPVQE